MRNLIVRLVFSLLVLLALLVLYDLARAGTDEYLWHRLASGEKLQYIWKDNYAYNNLGVTEVKSCVTGGAILVENRWRIGQTWYTHSFTLYPPYPTNPQSWKNENMEEPRVEYFASCNIYVKTNVSLYNKQVARLIFIPDAFHSSQFWPPH